MVRQAHHDLLCVLRCLVALCESFFIHKGVPLDNGPTKDHPGPAEGIILSLSKDDWLTMSIQCFTDIHHRDALGAATRAPRDISSWRA
jgi:hypothetical protein